MARTLERLEWGKLCESESGPSLRGAEAGWLDASSGFPNELRALCTPEVWELGDSPSEIDTVRAIGCAYLVLPFRLAGKTVRVGAAFARRSEDGEGLGGREFWRARFAWDPSGSAGAGALARALLDLPMRGWTHDQRATPLPLPNADADAAASSEQKPELAQFCEQAARWIVRGMPVGVRPPCDARRFFAVAAQVEARLPAVLQPLIGVAWGVTRLRSAQFALAYAEEFALGTAVFDGATQTWTPPVARAPAAPAAPTGGLDRSRSLPFCGPDVQRLLAAEGRRAAAELREASVNAWLEATDAPEVRDPPLGDENAREELSRLADLGVRALERGAALARAETLLVALLRRPGRDVVAERLRQATPAAARVLAALFDADPAALLEAWGSDPLLPWSRQHVAACLSRTFGRERELSAVHARVLVSSTQPPPEYEAWVAEHGARLALGLATFAAEPDRKRALEALAGRLGAPEIRMLSALLYGDALSEPPVPAKWKTVVEQLALRRWRERPAHAAAECEQALRWLRTLGCACKDPLLTPGALSPAELAELAAALRDDRVPESLLDGLAARALEHAQVFLPSLRDEVSTWLPVLRRWPPDVRLLLVPRAPGLVSTPDTPHEVEEVRHKLKLTWSQLEEIGQSAAREGALVRADSAGLFVAWCAGLSEGPIGPSLVSAVRWLWHGRGGIAQALDHATRAALIALQGAKPIPPENVRGLWKRATTAEQLSLLLELFGKPDHELSVTELELLLAQPRALTRVLATRGDIPERDPFVLCTREWQAFRAMEAAAPWHPRYAGTRLSGLFSGLPHELEAPLDELLTFYAKRSGSTAWDLARIYLAERGDTGRLEDTQDRFWKSLIQPACTEAGLNEKHFGTLLEIAEWERRGVAITQGMSRPIVLQAESVVISPVVADVIRTLHNPERVPERLADYKALLRDERLAREGMERWG